MSEDLNEILQLKREKLSRLQQQNKNPFDIVKYDVTAHTKQILDDFSGFEGTEVSLAGRILTMRIMGKAAFLDLSDRDGRIQIFISKSELGDEVFDDFKKDFDIGDIIGIKGTVFKTKTEETSIRCKNISLLSKSLQILPEKFHGLKDQEARYRQRYLDLIVNPESRSTFVKRSLIIKSVRKFLDNRGYLEVETPVLINNAGGAAARPFVTHHNTLDINMYLRIALELPLKQLLVGGLERVYEIGRVFRNEGMSIKHNPEFTMLELYEAYTDYYGMMELTESLFKTVSMEVLGTEVITYGDVVIDLSKPFEKITMIDAVKKYANIDFDQVTDLEEAIKLAKQHELHIESYYKKGDILNLFFEKYAEEKLIQPTFLMDHPIEISPLTKRKVDKPDYTERFELFIFGREFANAYSELNDPIDQRDRFVKQEEKKAKGDEEANTIDEDFILSLEYGFPPTGGLGIGMDRFIMFLTNSYSIRDVLLFPTMKPIVNP